MHAHIHVHTHTRTHTHAHTHTHTHKLLGQKQLPETRHAPGLNRECPSVIDHLHASKNILIEMLIAVTS